MKAVAVSGSIARMLHRLLALAAATTLAGAAGQTSRRDKRG